MSKLNLDFMNVRRCGEEAKMKEIRKAFRRRNLDVLVVSEMYLRMGRRNMAWGIEV